MFYSLNPKDKLIKDIILSQKTLTSSVWIDGFLYILKINFICMSADVISQAWILTQDILLT